MIFKKKSWFNLSNHYFILFVFFLLGWKSWSTWSSCPVSCGGGIQRRRRLCVKDVADACEGLAEETRNCNEFGCTGKVMVYGFVYADIQKDSHKFSCRTYIHGIWARSFFLYSFCKNTMMNRRICRLELVTIETIKYQTNSHLITHCAFFYHSYYHDYCFFPTWISGSFTCYINALYFFCKLKNW